MPPHRHRLSKSRFLSGRQCDLRLWYEVHARELAAPPDAAAEARFAAGREVGVLARDRFPGGVLIEADHLHGGDAVRETATHLASGVPLYEAGFEHAGVLVRVDVLEPRAPGGFGLVEVKSSTGVKAVHDLDVAIQAWVLRGAGVDLRGVGVLTLDPGYVWPGGAYDLDALFRLHERREQVESLLPGIGPEVARLHAVVAGDTPRIAPGAHCRAPYECPFLAHCTRGTVPADAWPLSTLPGLSGARRDALEARGIIDVRDVPEDFPLGALQRIARDAILTGRDIVHGDLAGRLDDARRPLRYLDFESVGPALPRYPGTHAYDLVPFQFSVHTGRADGSLAHAEFLHPDADDPREPLARALLDALGESGSIVVYSGFERRAITRLAVALPRLAPRLEALLPRLFDLLPVVRGCYYHPAFRGSFSIKSVLPAMVPGLSYEDLEIADGGLAALRYLHALDCGDVAERERIFAALRAYCARDTLALARIHDALAARAHAG